jgi:uncharacterized protein YacL
MEKFKIWLATTPLGSFVKVMLGAVLGALLSYVPSSTFNPLVIALTAAVVPVLINFLNDADTRYGKGKVE